jgi:hypothetical protein
LTNNLQKRKICARWFPHAWLLNRNRNAWKLQHYWNKDLTLKVKHSCIKLSLLTKCGLETLNRSLNHSQTSGEVQPPCDTKNFDERYQRSSKWWFLFMITKESSWQVEFHVEQVWQHRIIITRCKNCAEKCTKTDLTCSGMGHSFCTTMHACTWGRLWPICWVNTSGKCYLTRHTVQTWVHRTSTYFPS